MSSIDNLNNLTEIDFVETDVETILTEMISEYESAYQESTGESKTLADGDPIRILLYANAARIYAVLQSINNAAYATGDYLDQLGREWKQFVTRLKPRRRRSGLRFRQPKKTRQLSRPERGWRRGKFILGLQSIKKY